MSWRAAISAWTRKHVGCQREHERDESDLCASVGGWWSGVDGGGGLTSRKRAQPTGRLVCSRKPSLKAGGGGEEALEPLRWRRSSLCCPLQGGMGLQRHGPGLGPGAALVVASREADLAQLPCPIARPASFGDEVHHAEGRLSSLACRDAARAVEICVGPLAPCSKREKGKGKGRLAILVGNLQSGCRPWVPGVSQRLGASPGNTLLRKAHGALSPSTRGAPFLFLLCLPLSKIRINIPTSLFLWESPSCLVSNKKGVCVVLSVHSFLHHPSAPSPKPTVHWNIPPTGRPRHHYTLYS